MNQAGPVVLAGTTGFAPYGQRLGLAAGDLLERRTPTVQLVVHAHSSRPFPATAVGCAHV